MTFLEKLNWTTILSIMVAVELQIGNGSMSLAHMFPPDWIPYIQAWSANLGSLGALIMAGNNFGGKIVPANSIAIPQHAVDTPDQAKAKTGDTVTIGGQTTRVVGAILIAFALSLFVLGDAKAAQPSTDPLAAFKAFAVEDIQSALDDANSQDPPDTVAATCYAAILPLVQAAKLTIPQKGVGAFFALQKARDVVNKAAQVKANVGPLADAKNKCAAVVMDTQNFLLQLGLLGGGAILKPF